MEQLRREPRAVGELARALGVTQPAVSQHLRVLEEARLVTFRRDGRRKVYAVSTDGLAELRAWLEGLWGDVLSAFAADDPAPPRPSRRSQRRVAARPTPRPPDR